nr:hypothetical protein [Candidatus Gracilibacteria bacterium]
GRVMERLNSIGDHIRAEVATRGEKTLQEYQQLAYQEEVLLEVRKQVENTKEEVLARQEQVLELRDLVRQQKFWKLPDMEGARNKRKFKKEIRLKDKNLEKLDKRLEKVQTQRENLEAKMESKFEKQLNSQEAIIGVLTKLNPELKPAEAKQIIALIQSKKLSINANSKTLIQGEGEEFKEKISKINESAKTMSVAEKRLIKSALKKFLERKGDRLAKFEEVRGGIRKLRETKSELENLKNLKVGDEVKLDKDALSGYEKGDYQVVGVDKNKGQVFLRRPTPKHDWGDVIKMILPQNKEGLKYENIDQKDWENLKEEKNQILSKHESKLKELAEKLPDNPSDEQKNETKNVLINYKTLLNSQKLKVKDLNNETIINYIKNIQKKSGLTIFNGKTDLGLNP